MNFCELSFGFSRWCMSPSRIAEVAPLLANALEEAAARCSAPVGKHYSMYLV